MEYQPDNSGNTSLHLLTGVIVLDSSFEPLWLNPEAGRIFQQAPDDGRRNTKPLKQQLAEIAQPFDKRYPFRAEFKSGRRAYLCRGYPLRTNPDSKITGSTAAQPSMALLLERSRVSGSDMDAVARFYRLSARESVALGLLIQGLPTKDIAARMKISPNTVQAFLRLVMSKMGVNTRTGLMKKVTDHG